MDVPAPFLPPKRGEIITEDEYRRGRESLLRAKAPPPPPEMLGNQVPMAYAVVAASTEAVEEPTAVAVRDEGEVDLTDEELEERLARARLSLINAGPPPLPPRPTSISASSLDSHHLSLVTAHRASLAKLNRSSVVGARTSLTIAPSSPLEREPAGGGGAGAPHSHSSISSTATIRTLDEETGREYVTTTGTHKGRPMSVTVELKPDGKVSAIVGGTARLPGESERTYFRQMSSFALNQIRDTPDVVGCRWSGDQRYAYFCYLMIVVMFFVLLGEIANNGWTVQPFSENPTFGPTPIVLVRMGAKRTDLIHNGDFYRLFAPIFLHGGILHYLFNMLAIRNVGFALEREFGSPKIAIIFFTSGFLGVLTSAVMLPNKVGVGASGAIFGLFGSSIADLIQNWGLYKQRGVAKTTALTLTIGTVVNILIGFAPFLDQFAHVSGLICGIFLGFSLLVHNRYTRFAEKKGKNRKQICLKWFGLVATPAFLILMFCLLYAAPPASVWCPKCKYFSCIPLNNLWSCDDCTDVSDAEFFRNNTVAVTCPSFAENIVVGNITDFVTAGYEDVVRVCRESCQL